MEDSASLSIAPFFLFVSIPICSRCIDVVVKISDQNALRKRCHFGTGLIVTMADRFRARPIVARAWGTVSLVAVSDEEVLRLS